MNRLQMIFLGIVALVLLCAAIAVIAFALLGDIFPVTAISIKSPTTIDPISPSGDDNIVGELSDAKSHKMQVVVYATGVEPENAKRWWRSDKLCPAKISCPFAA